MNCSVGLPEKFWKTTDVLTQLLTALYQLSDQSVGERISHLYIVLSSKLSIIRQKGNSHVSSRASQTSHPLILEMFPSTLNRFAQILREKLRSPSVSSETGLRNTQ